MFSFGRRREILCQAVRGFPQKPGGQLESRHLPMTETNDVREVIAAAERAAERADYVLAEQLLRRAVTMLERDPGGPQPDLANTLNNLGVACEQAGNLDEAEHAYRRACTVALANYPPDHPFVVRSNENLRDFCAARGRPFDLRHEPTPGPAAVSTAAEGEAAPGIGPATDGLIPVEADVAADVSSSVDPETTAETVSAKEVDASAQKEHLAAVQPVVAPPEPVAFEPMPPASPPPSSVAPLGVTRRDAAPQRRTAFAAVVLLVIAVLLILWLSGLLTSDSPQSGGAVDATAEASVAQADAVAGPVVMPLVEGGDVPATFVAPVDGAASGVVDDIAAIADTGEDLVVTRATLCRSFSVDVPRGSDWRCEEAGSAPIAPGSVVFYTRVRSPEAISIEHRWYRGSELDQTVSLDLAANTGAGYRTYSQRTIAPALAGEWRVELRSAAGVLLHSDEFAVR